MVLSRSAGDPALEPGPRTGRFRLPAVMAVVFGGAALVSAELFSRFTEAGAPFVLALVALLPLQAVALVWLWSQRRSFRKARSRSLDAEQGPFSGLDGPSGSPSFRAGDQG